MSRPEGLLPGPAGAIAPGLRQAGVRPYALHRASPADGSQQRNGNGDHDHDMDETNHRVGGDHAK